MKLYLKKGHLWLESVDQKVTKDKGIKVHFETDLPKDRNKFFYAINDNRLQPLKHTFTIPEKYYNQKITIRVKTDLPGDTSALFKTDPTPINIFASTLSSFTMELPQSIKNIMKEMEQIRKENKELRDKYKNLAQAVVELGKKGELL